MMIKTIGNATAKTAALRTNATPTSIQVRQLFMTQNLKRGCESKRAFGLHPLTISNLIVTLNSSEYVGTLVLRTSKSEESGT